MGNTQNFLTNVNANEETPLKNVTINCLSAICNFKGRMETLIKIQEHFTRNKMVVICGGPGIGKTEAARYFANRNIEYFSGNLIWIYAETQENIQKCFNDLSRSLCLQISDVSQVYGKFRTSPCLFIFDNAQNMASIRYYLPSSQLHPTVHVLITSQYSEWDSSVCNVHLGPLSSQDALDILRDKLGKKYEEYPSRIWEDLVEHLEGIPLSIQIVSSLINEEFSKVRISKFNLERFIGGLAERFINSEFPESEIIVYNKTVFSSIHLALKRLQNEDTGHSSDLLIFMAYLDPDCIYHKDLLGVPSIKESEEKLETTLNKLRQYSFIQVEHVNEDRLKIKIHRTIQLVLRKYDLMEQNGLIFKTVLKTIIFNEKFNHFNSVFKYVKEEEFKDKSVEFYDENTTQADLYLVYLARYNCHEILKELLPKLEGEYIGTDNYTKTLNKLLYEAIYSKNNMLTIDLLIKYGAKINISPRKNTFHLASSWLSIELFDRLLESDDSKNIIHSKDFLGRTILHRLVIYFNEENMEKTINCMEYLISKWNADISIRDEDNNTILHTACENENICLQIIKLLAEKCNCKKITNNQNKLGITPLQYLLQFNNLNSDLLKMVSYFINECEADIKIQDNKKWDTVFYVCRYGNSEIIEFILRSGNYRHFINNQDMLGNVAFTQLIYNESIEEEEIIELMNLFIENEMDFKTRNKKKKTLYKIAEEGEYKKLSDKLKQQFISLIYIESTKENESIKFKKPFIENKIKNNNIKTYIEIAKEDEYKKLSDKLKQQSESSYVGQNQLNHIGIFNYNVIKDHPINLPSRVCFSRFDTI